MSEPKSQTQETNNKLENLEEGTIHESAFDAGVPAQEDAKISESIGHALKLGGVAGIFAGLSYIAGFVLFGVSLKDLFDDHKLNATERVAFLKDNKVVFYVANLLVYVLNGFLQIILSYAIHQYLNITPKAGPTQGPTRGHHYSNLAAVFGSIWGALVIAAGMTANGGAHVATKLYDNDAQMAATLWASIDAVYSDGIGGGNEIVGAVWVLMISTLSFCSCGRASFPKPLNMLGVIAALAGIATLIPGLDEATSIFGICMLVWYILAGIWLFREAIWESTYGVDENET